MGFLVACGGSEPTKTVSAPPVVGLYRFTAYKGQALPAPMSGGSSLVAGSLDLTGATREGTYRMVYQVSSSNGTSSDVQTGTWAATSDSIHLVEAFGGRSIPWGCSRRGANLTQLTCEWGAGLTLERAP